MCKIASWKYIKRNILTMHGPLNVKFISLALCPQFTFYLQQISQILNSILHADYLWSLRQLDALCTMTVCVSLDQYF